MKVIIDLLFQFFFQPTPRDKNKHKNDHGEQLKGKRKFLFYVIKCFWFVFVLFWSVGINEIVKKIKE